MRITDISLAIYLPRVVTTYPGAFHLRSIESINSAISSRPSPITAANTADDKRHLPSSPAVMSVYSDVLENEFLRRAIRRARGSFARSRTLSTLRTRRNPTRMSSIATTRRATRPSTHRPSAGTVTMSPSASPVATPSSANGNSPCQAQFQLQIRLAGTKSRQTYEFLPAFHPRTSWIWSLQ